MILYVAFYVYHPGIGNIIIKEVVQYPESLPQDELWPDNIADAINQSPSYNGDKVHDCDIIAWSVISK